MKNENRWVVIKTDLNNTNEDSSTSSCWVFSTKEKANKCFKEKLMDHIMYEREWGLIDVAEEGKCSVADVENQINDACLDGYWNDNDDYFLEIKETK